MTNNWTPERIKELRKALDLTQLEFSNKLKVNYISVSRYERGTQRPKDKIQQRLSRLERRI